MYMYIYIYRQIDSYINKTNLHKEGDKQQKQTATHGPPTAPDTVLSNPLAVLPAPLSTASKHHPVLAQGLQAKRTKERSELEGVHHQADS